MQYMSIITNFGCHYKCPYCIVKENNLHIPRTTLAGLDNLKARIAESAIKVSTVKAPHTYMKAVGTRELEKILEEELGNEDTK